MIRTNRYKYVRRIYEKDELYDLERDPCEVDNRIDDPEYGEILSMLRERMLTWYMETADVVPLKVNARESTPSHIDRAKAFNEAHGVNDDK